MTDVIANFSMFKDKDAIVTLAGSGDPSVVVAGKILAGSEIGILIKNRATRQPEFYETPQIADIIEEPAAPKGRGRILVRDVRLETEADVRQHLADRHGLVLPAIPDDPMLALKMHAKLHTDPLGHRHIIKGTPAERAAQIDAATDADG